MAHSAPSQPAFFDGETWIWDRWEQSALARGLDPELATLGREVMRENLQHAWTCPNVARLCREPLITELAFRAPDFARALWNVLLESDGLDGCNGQDGSFIVFEDYA